MIVSADLAALTEQVRAEAGRHPARSRERRATSHLLFALTEPSARTIASARNAIATFGDEQTQADAIALLHRLASERTPA